ncbi:hypothetical protein K435DRAFT_792327 [Dendrothele bispora CBS 962.96]|uniref:Uncharacterized protein n=1 Tax=Dendrothele bispora (strain CBS 962.96) TaxID=1314807 RepID=A0A4S8MKH3_DENBC|nr:hypothetical protein K435DRAFT_792327 [Dendrothele bispora CBS 962.96]
MTLVSYIRRSALGMIRLQLHSQKRPDTSIGYFFFRPGPSWAEQWESLPFPLFVSTRSPSTLYSRTTPWKGTRGFFITEGADTQRLLLVTAHHVVFTSDRNTEIEDKTFMVKYQEGRNRVVELEERPAGEQETPESSARIGRGKGGGRRAQHFLPGCFNSMGHPREPYLGSYAARSGPKLFSADISEF